ncbi:MAG: AAA family ATPase [Spirochaetia bacterium]|jgi:putative ATP-dependent endonuclease of OLD family|nr:AAA family ATPase [Spirochaetia bacterium]
MYLKKIVIRNFRIFDAKGITVKFNKGVNAIIGENNTGKSAVIDAIRIAFGAVLYRKDIFFSKADFHIDAQGKRAETSQFDVYLEDVPKQLIEIWDPQGESLGEFHIHFYIDSSSYGNRKVKYKAWGDKEEGNQLSAETFYAINLAYLGALRDAENEMKPSRSSKLATLLDTVVEDDDKKADLVNILQQSNTQLLQAEPIIQIKDIINANLQEIEQELLSQQIDIGLVEPRFESITSSLRSWILPKWYFIQKDYEYYDRIISKCIDPKFSRLIQQTDDGMYLAIDEFLKVSEDSDDSLKSSLRLLRNHSFELYQNGLGYNNILFMATVLGDMSLEKSGVYLNLFVVEEPEAHLHPQLQELIHSFFEKRYNTSSVIQVIYTSHSPTLVSRIDINAINLLYEKNHAVCCYPLEDANLEEKEKDYLEKYIDVTKSQMFFAKGILFVEGISEAILLPDFAALLNRQFDKYAVELVNINGTAFTPFAKIATLPGEKGSFAKTAIVTDDDRCSDANSLDTYISKDLDFKTDFKTDLTDILNKLDKGTCSDRCAKIQALCSNYGIGFYQARKTFEYELALEKDNIQYMLEAIVDVFPQVGVELKKEVEQDSSLDNKAIMIWLFIRKRDASKAQIAQSLSRIIKQQLKKIAEDETVTSPFVVPEYIKNAIYSVTTTR